MLRIAALVFACLSVSCVNTPSGPRNALALSESSILEARPENIQLAFQTTQNTRHIAAGPLELLLFSEDKTSVFDETLDTRVIATGLDVGHDLPPAREGQGWIVLALNNQGVRELERAQAIFQEMKATGRKGSMRLKFGWTKKDGSPAGNLPKIVYVTTAIRLSPDDPWLTMMDNYPVYPDTSPDKNSDADTNTNGTEATP